MPDNASSTEDYMTVAQAREYLGINRVRIAQLIADGTLPTFKRGRDKRVKWLRKTDVEALWQYFNALYPDQPHGDNPKVRATAA